MSSEFRMHSKALVDPARPQESYYQIDNQKKSELLKKNHLDQFPADVQNTIDKMVQLKLPNDEKSEKFITEIIPKIIKLSNKNSTRGDRDDITKKIISFAKKYLGLQVLSTDSRGVKKSDSPFKSREELIKDIISEHWLPSGRTSISEKTELMKVNSFKLMTEKEKSILLDQQKIDLSFLHQGILSIPENKISMIVTRTSHSLTRGLIEAAESHKLKEFLESSPYRLNQLADNIASGVEIAHKSMNKGHLSQEMKQEIRSAILDRLNQFEKLWVDNYTQTNTAKKLNKSMRRLSSLTSSQAPPKLSALSSLKIKEQDILDIQNNMAIALNADLKSIGGHDGKDLSKHYKNDGKIKEHLTKKVDTILFFIDEKASKIPTGWGGDKGIRDKLYEALDDYEQKWMKFHHKEFTQLIDNFKSVGDDITEYRNVLNKIENKYHFTPELW